MHSIIPVRFSTAESISQEIAARCKKLRLHHNLSQKSLSQKSGVSVGTIQKFEANHSEITLVNLLRLAKSLDAVDQFSSIFNYPKLRSISDLENLAKSRKRGRT